MPPIARAVSLDSVEWSYNANMNPKDRGRAKTLISKELTEADDLRLGVGWLEPGEVHIPHHHPDASEFYYLLEGQATITVGDQAFDANAGTAVYIPTGARHAIVNDGEETAVVIFGYNRGQYETIWDK